MSMNPLPNHASGSGLMDALMAECSENLRICILLWFSVHTIDEIPTRAFARRMAKEEFTKMERRILPLLIQNNCLCLIMPTRLL